MFTGRFGDRDPGTYADNFDDVRTAGYTEFVSVLKPATVEEVQQSPNGKFPMVSQRVPTENLDGAARSLINEYNYFFGRAISGTDQVEFLKEKQALNQGEPLLPQQDLPTDAYMKRRPVIAARGRSIFEQIRTNLDEFCSFQTKTPQIVLAFARLLGMCGNKNGLPAFAAGARLPGGLPERLIDLLYHENDSIGFDTAGLNFEGTPLAALQNAPEAKETFSQVVNAFRDSLLGIQGHQQNELEFRGQTLSVLARSTAVVTDQLRADFARSRRAFNSLRQILRSKILLSMVLDWVVSDFYAEPVVAGVRDEADYDDQRDRTVETAILTGGAGLAAPVKRPDAQERRRFAKALTDHFEQLMTMALAEKAAVPPKGFPTELVSLANQIRGRGDLLRALRNVTGAQQTSADEAQKKRVREGFIRACKTVLLDVLLPVLYRKPIVDEGMLRNYFRQATIDVYLQSLLMSKKNEDKVRAIAEEHAALFAEEHIDSDTQKVKNEGRFEAKVLERFIEKFVADDEVQRQVAAGIAVINEVHTLFDASDPDAARGAGSISSIFPSEESRDAAAAPAAAAPAHSLDKTAPDREIVRALATKRIAAVVASSLKASAAPAGPAVNDGAGEGAAPQVPVPTKPADDEQSLSQAPALDDEVLAILDRLPKPENRKPDAQAITQQVTKELLTPGKIDELSEKMRAFERMLHLIYTRYGEQKGKADSSFVNQVERMTLMNMMLLFKGDLGLGSVSSNLYQMLIDLVLHVDKKSMDLTTFKKQASLTRYFDNDTIAGGGMTDLRQTLEEQGINSLRAVVNFVSELRGIKYLMDKVDKDAEIIVVNATADEFIDWLESETYVGATPRGRLNAGSLITATGSGKTIPPGLVYLTDLAFPSGNKRGWLSGKLAGVKMFDNGKNLIIPPIVISTDSRHSSEGWKQNKADLEKAASSAPAPVVVVGPSLFLNRQGDGFPTYLPAGYVFCAHFLSRPDQQIDNRGVGDDTTGRFRVMGYGDAPMRDSLDRIIWGRQDGDYQFCVDCYLYYVLILAVTGKRLGGGPRFDPVDFYKMFHSGQQVVEKKEYRSSARLDPALPFGKAMHFALDQNPAAGNLQTVSHAENGGDLSNDKTPRWHTKQIRWFNLAVENMKIHVLDKIPIPD